MYKLWNKRFFKKCDLVTYLVTDRQQTGKVFHRGAQLLKMNIFVFPHSCLKVPSTNSLLLCLNMMAKCWLHPPWILAWPAVCPANLPICRQISQIKCSRNPKAKRDKNYIKWRKEDDCIIAWYFLKTLRFFFLLINVLNFNHGPIIKENNNKYDSNNK